MTSLSPLQLLLLEEDVKESDNNDNNNNDQEQGKQIVPVVQEVPINPAPITKTIKKTRRLPSRPGFRMQGMGLEKRIMKYHMETKLFLKPCYLRFVVTRCGKNWERLVYPLDCIGDFAHFLFRAYSRYPVRLRVFHRRPDGQINLVIDQHNIKEYIGIVNGLGKTDPRGQRKPFQLFFLHWREHFFVMKNWRDSRDPRY